MSLNDFSLVDVVMLAAAKVEETNKPFTTSQIVVAAWILCPNRFGLAGYEQAYPDSNKVLTYLMGEKGLARRGYLIKRGSKLYETTKEGRNLIRRLHGEEEEPSPTNKRVSAGDSKQLNFWLTDPIMKKLSENKSSISFSDAFRFWGISDNARNSHVDKQLTKVKDQLNQFEILMADDDVELTNGRIVKAGDLRVIRCLHSYLLDRFSRHLDLVRRKVSR